MNKLVALMLISILVLSSLVIAGIFIIYPLINNSSSSDSPTNGSSSPNPSESPDSFVINSVTANPSNSTPGLVTVTGEITNNGAQNETVLVVMQIKEPNGDTMSIENNSLLLEITARETITAKFEPIIPLNVKIGIFNAQLEVYDINQTINYYSTGFIYPFTTPVRYHIYPDLGPKGFDFMMTVDGKTYHEGQVFYWYLGEIHTIIVPHIVMVNDVYGWIFDGWGGPDGNVLELNVTTDHPTDIEISYGLYYP